MTATRFSYIHISDPDVFREFLSYSEADTGFTGSLIERDYFCSLLLQYFFGSETSLVFKGGTCLSKVYVNFYRLSEDLDFIIPVTADSTRPQRSTMSAPVKTVFNNAPRVIQVNTLWIEECRPGAADRETAWVKYRSPAISS
jgi:hypothetical protein